MNVLLGLELGLTPSKIDRPVRPRRNHIIDRQFDDAAMQDRTDPRHGSVNQGISAAVRAPTSTKDSPAHPWQRFGKIKAEAEKRVSPQARQRGQ